MRCCSLSEVISLSLTPPPPPPLSSYTNSHFRSFNLHFQFQFHNPNPLFKFNNTSTSFSFSISHRHHRVVTAVAPVQPSISTLDFDYAQYLVVNFYHFGSIKDPHALVDKHLSFLHLQLTFMDLRDPWRTIWCATVWWIWRTRNDLFLTGLDIHGRIYLNEQGINAQYSGPSKDALAYLNWLREDNKFSDILAQISPSENGHAFPKLKLRYKPTLVQCQGGISHLPLHDPSARAIPLSPSEWKNKLESINKTDLISEEHPNGNNIILDVRNGYEWDVGHFHGAQRPNVDCFRNTSFGLSEEEITASDPLSNVDKEKANILMYCTGGIRCDVYSTILRQQGFQNLYTLEGGISHYLKNEGPAEWVGNLFVFDSRLALPPSVFYPLATTEADMTQVSGDDKFAKCYICCSEVTELRHRNCANLDCNLLFLCCRKCVEDLRGCCCLSCTTAPRLRPVLSGEHRYKKWHIYRDMNVLEKMKIST